MVLRIPGILTEKDPMYVINFNNCVAMIKQQGTSYSMATIYEVCDLPDYSTPSYCQYRTYRTTVHNLKHNI